MLYKYMDRVFDQRLVIDSKASNELNKNTMLYIQWK